MSLRNRNETKLLMENWRKVLSEGLYDEDPELLEEGFVKNALIAALFAGSMLGNAQAKVSSGQLKKAGIEKVDNSSSYKKSKKFAGRIKNLLARNSKLFQGNTEQQLAAMELAEILSSPQTVKLSAEQMSMLSDVIGEDAKFIKDFKERYRKIKEKMQKAQKFLSKYKDPQTLGTGGAYRSEGAKADLKAATAELESLSIELAERSGTNYVIEHNKEEGEIQLINKNTQEVILSIDDYRDAEMNRMADQGIDSMNQDTDDGYGL